MLRERYQSKNHITVPEGDFMLAQAEHWAVILKPQKGRWVCHKLCTSLSVKGFTLSTRERPTGGVKTNLSHTATFINVSWKKTEGIIFIEAQWKCFLLSTF